MCVNELSMVGSQRRQTWGSGAEFALKDLNLRLEPPGADVRAS